MKELPIIADLSILKKYSPYIESLYNTYRTAEQSEMLRQIIVQIDVSEEEYGSFEIQFLELMVKFKVPEEHCRYLLYIVQNIENKKAYFSEYLHDYIEGKQILLFLRDYQLQFEALKDDRRKEVILNQSVVQVHINGKNIRLENGRFSHLMLSSFIKTLNLQPLNFQLRNLPDDIDTLSVDYINRVIQKFDYIIKHPYRLIVIEVIHDLLHYMNTYMEGHLVRKKYLLIFELLYLFNFIKLTTEEEDDSNEERRRGDSKPGTSKRKKHPYERSKDFYPLKRIKDKEKNAFIKSLIEGNRRRRNKPYRV